LNLIITCARFFENEAEEEIKRILAEIGDENPTVTISKMPGILTVDTNLDSVDVVKWLRQKILDEPWIIRYCLRIIPIQIMITTNLEEISSEISKLVGVIGPKETFRITIEKRNSNLSKNEIINKIAKNIQNKVSLNQPDWIVLIEIIGNNTGLAVLRDDSILSLQKIKRSLSS